jgi:hypothetical protein
MASTMSPLTTLGSPGLFLGFGGIGGQVRRHDHVVDGHAPAFETTAPHFFDQDTFVAEVTTEPAIGFRNGRAQHSEFPGLAPEIPINHLVGIPLCYLFRRRVRIEKAGNALAEHGQVFFGELAGAGMLGHSNRFQVLFGTSELRRSCRSTLPVALRGRALTSKIRVGHL